METQGRMTPEMQFCIEYLRDNGVRDGGSYEAMLGKIKTGISKFRIVPKIESDFFTELAGKMRELWPSGKKDNKYDWRDSVDNLSKRLKWLWDDRNLGRFSMEQCLLVCRKYLAAYTMNTKYMKLLKYFIFKRREMDSVGKNGEIHYSYESEFANMLESLTEDEIQAQKDAEVIELLPDDFGGTLI